MVSKNRSTKDLIHKFSNKSSKLNQFKGRPMLARAGENTVEL